MINIIQFWSKNKDRIASSLVLALWYLVEFLRYLLLFLIINTAFVLWVYGQMAKAIGKNPNLILFGQNPKGAASIIKSVAKVMFSLSTKARTTMGRYVRNHHPEVYKRLFILFQ